MGSGPTCRIGDVPKLLKDAGARWVEDRCPDLGAALAFYALFSLFPLLLLTVTAIGVLVGHGQEARQELLRSVPRPTSPELQALLDQTLASMQAHLTARGIGAAVGIVTLLFGTSGVFSELHATLNLIWRVTAPPSRGIWAAIVGLVKGKAVSFVIAMVAAAVLLASLILSTVLNAVASSGIATPWRMAADITLSIGFLTGLFAVVFRELPETAVAWGDVLGGALLSATVLTGLKHVLGWYLSHAGSYAAYGAVGAVLGLLMWIYAVGLTLFFGAELTYVFARRFGSLSRAAGSGRTPGAHPSVPMLPQKIDEATPGVAEGREQ